MGRPPLPSSGRRPWSSAGRRGPRRRGSADTERLGDKANDELTAALTPAEREQLIGLLTRVVQPEEPCRGTRHTGP
ncbi:hypothetical protein EYS09_00105 [Streptomyces kasugaensis]|uniref:MarR family transcriptional regulator n=1 Tax=Streptomyces kasugaensis TaxID=1946 RepID=A0A4Q9I3S8_STRKA|nr:hypothetical protein EYS09_00105 [Streptomyces kasugaensis]